MKSELEGKPLSVSASIGESYARSIKSVIALLHKDVIASVKSLNDAYGQDSDLPEGGNYISQLKIIINNLLKKYNPIFRVLAKKAVDKMLSRVLKNSSATLKISLREISKDLAVKTDLMNDDIKNSVLASTIENVSLIKTIPQKYLSDVQSAVMQSITTGKGVKDLIPQLNKYYKGSARKAELVALDQTSKIYNNINAERMRRLGVKSFKWIHSGGGREPRRLHVDMNGKVYDFDDPPFIGVMYGERVNGLPGQLPNCGCKMAPVIEFKSD